jgi:hypothetical protein
MQEPALGPPLPLHLVHCDHVAVAPVGSCSAVKAELMPTTPESVCLLVGGQRCVVADLRLVAKAITSFAAPKT